ncbi:hypothetical protein PanWU01x14_214790 [Parasponia andersonii]|uniref:Uncharacterized protein n=1 Tax=Parasponia andersonii TaxID=3476 RepID=A0A2P5BS73_PARAD|nr:hypothetical protein PanWU01x14_214790 [Parasponia andersonii]
MLTMETRSQNTIPKALPPNPGGTNGGGHFLFP